MTNLFANLLHGHAPTGGARELLFSFVVVLTAILTGARRDGDYPRRYSLVRSRKASV